jgi:hypothetical protein
LSLLAQHQFAGKRGEASHAAIMAADDDTLRSVPASIPDSSQEMTGISSGIVD